MILLALIALTSVQKWQRNLKVNFDVLISTGTPYYAYVSNIFCKQVL